MLLADPGASRAVLIGTHTFTDLDPLPAVSNNLLRLRETLTDPVLWGLPAEHCTVIEQPGHPGEVLDAVRTAAEAAHDTLLVYYAGHGLIDHRASDRADKLCLSLPDSHPSQLYRSVRYRDLRGLLLDARRALRKVVVLDCCFSGQAAMTMGPGDLADEAGIHGVYVLTSAGANAESLAFAGARYTAFTGEFLALIEEGLPDGPELLTLDTLYDRVRRAAHHKGLPEPRRSATDTSHNLALVRNRAYTALPPEVVHEREIARLWEELRRHYDELEAGAHRVGGANLSGPRLPLPSAAWIWAQAERHATYARTARALEALRHRRAEERRRTEEERRRTEEERRRAQEERDRAEEEPCPAADQVRRTRAERTEPQQEFADVLRAAWRSGGALPVPELARRMGCTQATADDLLTGRRFPTWHQVSAFATACGVAPSSFDGAWSQTKLRVRERRRPQRPKAPVRPPSLSPAAGLLGDALRSAFRRLELTPLRFAEERNLDPDTVARYAAGAELPPWQFVHDLNAEVRGRSRYGFDFQGHTLPELYRAAEKAPRRPAGPGGQPR
ncbi:caspase family protein [Streptomyces sp. NBC_01795]|uniref:caspase, EACC1-associated type n=1 Tax=Streptomyces sp. NBC_01795 TaxID=2975943 RepID=UPI002DDA6E51|nr:caspase family protein [Streptomyces sp. NBC_01795]WSA92648.1 caspase family protein [Streptomyces sp. NBC_01795]